MIEVYLRGLPASPNRRNRSSWYADARSTEQWRQDAMRAGYAAAHGHWHELPIEPATLEYVFDLPAKKGDLDNLVAACKPILDGLRDARIIRDDSVLCIPSLSASWRLAEEPGVHILIKEIPRATCEAPE